MRKGSLMIGAVCFVLFGAAAEQLARADEHGGYKLPGARPVIDAGNHESLQAALDAVPEGGAVVRIPAGTFEISQPLMVRHEDVTIEGAGTATHIKNINEEGKSAIILQHPSGQDNRASSLWRIRLSNFRVTGNEKSGHGIEARRIDEIFIDGVTVSYHGGDGIHLYFCYEDPRIVNNLITYNKKTGVMLNGCHDIVVAANQFEENMDALRCIDGFNLCMSGNNLDDHIGNGVVIENTYGSVVSGNMIEECQGHAIVIDRDCYGITLSANVIAHNFAGGIDLRDAHGCAVSANTFTIVKKHALAIGPGSGRITVSANNFSDSYIGDKTKRSGESRSEPNTNEAGGVFLDGAIDVTISGNVFSSVGPKALNLSDKPSKRIIFANNIVTDSASDHGQLGDSVVRDNLHTEPKRD